MSSMLNVGDIVFVRTKTWIGRLISFFTRERLGPFTKEDKTWATHVEVVVVAGDTNTARVISADRTGVTVRAIHPGAEIRVYRHKKAGDLEDWIQMRAGMIAGKKYPVWRLIPHMLDAILLDINLFRRIMRTSKVMVCSELAVWLFEPYAYFPFYSHMATPDGIMDHVKDSPEWNWILAGKAE